MRWTKGLGGAGIFAILSIFASTTQAGLESDLSDFFAKVNSGTLSNDTPGGAYQGQEGGFYTGGSFFMRTPSRNVQLLNVQMPKVEAGCGGIDLHMGGLGYINSARLIETLKSIGANSIGYAFSLALKQISPQIMNQIEELQSWMTDANWNNINSCEAAASLVNNTAAILHGGSVRSCIMQTLKSHGEDYFSARKHCQNQETVNSKNKEAASEGGVVMNDINIVWDTIQKNPTLKALDPALQWLFMSLTGTMVIQTVGKEAPTYALYPSKLQSDVLIESLLSGKNIEVYRCDEGACLNPVSSSITLNADQGFISQVRRIIVEMEQKVRADTLPLSAQEKAFLESTALPLYKMLNVYGAFTQGTALIFPAQYAEVIALDMVYRYIDYSIQALAQAGGNPHFPQELSKIFAKMLEGAQTRLNRVRLLQIQKTGTLDDMIAKVQMMEKKMTVWVSAQIVGRL